MHKSLITTCDSKKLMSFNYFKSTNGHKHGHAHAVDDPSHQKSLHCRGFECYYVDWIMKSCVPQDLDLYILIQKGGHAAFTLNILILESEGLASKQKAQVF